jgi:phosphoglycerate dehydrogenase-like enzyme
VTAAPAVRRRPVVVCFRPGIARPLAQAGLDCEIVQWRAGQTPPAGHRADVCLGGNLVDDSALAWAEGATWVHLTGVGHDNVPPGLLAGRVVTNSPGANAVQVAEFAFAGVLAAAKQLPETWQADPAVRWSDFPLNTLDRRVLGLIGYGHIGQAVASRALAFGMTVLVYTRTPRPDTGNTRFVTRDELAATADHIVVTASATAETRHIVGRALLEQTKEGVHLVNVSRGSLVDQEALRPFLDSGHVARATLDTVEPEPLPAGHWLRSHPRVKFSPHVAAVSPDSTALAVERFAANFRRYLAGEELADVVRLD